MKRQYLAILAALIAAIVIVAVCGCKKKEPQGTSTDSNLRTFPNVQASLDATAACINAIHARLLSLKQDYPQLSEVEGATVTATSLYYAKGNVRHDGKSEQWSSPDACKIYVNFEEHSLVDTHQKGTVRQFSQSGIQVHWLVLPIRNDSMGFLRAVDSTIKQEVDRLENSLQ